MKKYIGIVLCMLCVAGCQLVQEHSEREALDNEKARIIAKNYLSITEMQVGFIKGYNDMEEYPVEIVNAMDEILVLAADPNSLGDYDLGYSLGLRLMITEGIIRKYIPEISRYWP